MHVDPTFGLRSLGKLARELSVSMPLESLLETAAEGALSALQAASVSIGRVDHSGRSIRTLINVGSLAPSEVRWPEDESYPIEDWVRLSRVLADGVTRSDQLGADDCDAQEEALLVELGKGCSVTSAILVDGTAWGEFFATRDLGEAPFVDVAIDYVDALTAIVGAAISRCLRETTLEHLAFHDALTGVLNRRGLEHAAARIFELPEGSSRVVTVVALDINGLKQVNDTQGHSRGDALIETAARTLRDTFASYPGSVVARVGGDEFVVLVPHHDPILAARSVGALCRDVGRSWSFGTAAGISAGISSTVLCGSADAPYADLLSAADRALYKAKRQTTPAVVVSEDYNCRDGSGRRAGDR